MEKFTQKYRGLVATELKKFIENSDPIRLMFSPGSDVYFYITTIANQKHLTPREVVTVACRLLFLSIIGVENEPNQSAE